MFEVDAEEETNPRPLRSRVVERRGKDWAPDVERKFIDRILNVR